MIKRLKNIDLFSRNIIVLFAGMALFNFLNLLYQLLIAHQLSPEHFAAFNALLSLFLVISSPLNTIQIAVAKYLAQLRARGEFLKIKFLLRGLFKKLLIPALLTLLIFCFSSVFIINALKIPSHSAAYIFALLLALMWFIPLFKGAAQGTESFAGFSLALILTGAAKLTLAYLLIAAGYDIAGAIAALLISELIGLAIYYFCLRPYFARGGQKEERLDYRKLFGYILPPAATYFCFMSLVNVDMILVKYYFGPEESGYYSLAQMVGKILLFLPIAISTVMFPKTSGLNAVEQETTGTLKKSLFFAFSLCLAAALFYNLLPEFTLRVLTGKVFRQSLVLGRLFTVSMSFFTLGYLLMLYFLSVNRYSFLKYLFLSLGLEILAVIFFHRTLLEVQLVLCVNSAALFICYLFLARRHAALSPRLSLK